MSKHRKQRLDAAISGLAALYEYGELMAATMPAELLERAANEIAELRATVAHERAPAPASPPAAGALPCKHCGHLQGHHIHMRSMDPSRTGDWCDFGKLHEGTRYEPVDDAPATAEQPVERGRLPGWHWERDDYATHPVTRAWITIDVVTQRWAFFAHGAWSCPIDQHRDTAVQAAACALGYEISEAPGLCRPAWLSRGAGFESKPYPSEDLAAYAALEHADRHRTKGGV